MMNKAEMTKSIDLLVSDPMIFSAINWHAFESNRGTCCTGKETAEEKAKNHFCRTEIESIASPGSALADKVVERFRTFHERKYVYYDFAANAMARLLSDIDCYEAFEDLIKFSLRNKAEACLKALNKTERGR